MATYFLVNICFLLGVMVCCRLLPRRVSRRTLLTLLIILALTAVFDSIIVGFGIVAYDPTLISGIFIGNAPVEDFFYALLAVILVPTVWKRFGGTHDEHN